MALRDYKQFKKRLLNDSKVKKAYEDLGPEFALIEMFIKKRLEKGLTQKTLAQKLGTKQSAISRLESGAYNPSFSFLQKVARAMDAELEVALTEK